LFEHLPTPVQYALIDMAYNMKPSSLKQFVNLHKFLRAGNWKEASTASYRVITKGKPKEKEYRNIEVAKWIWQAPTPPGKPQHAPQKPYGNAHN
jgi:GH24 family phage-related lysozyme (muramidase)